VDRLALGVSGDLDINMTGDLTLDSVRASGRVDVQISGTLENTPNNVLTATDLTLIANKATLYTAVDRLSGVISDDMLITELDDLAVGSLASTNGDLTLYSGGAVTGLSSEDAHLSAAGRVAIIANAGVGGFGIERLQVQAATVHADTGRDSAADVVIHSLGALNIDEAGIRNAAQEGWTVLTTTEQVNGRSRIDTANDRVLTLKRSERMTEIEALALLDGNEVAIGSIDLERIGRFGEQALPVPTVGETLQIDAYEIEDGNGFSGNPSIQWLRDGVDIPGANYSTYTLQSSDAGSRIAVQLSFLDDAGYSEAIVSTSSETVNSIASGRLEVSLQVQEQGVKSDPVVGGTAKIRIIELSDTNGLPLLQDIQWFRNGVALVGETDSRYTFTESDIGAQFSVGLTFTDGSGNPELVLSSPTGPVGQAADQGRPEVDAVNENVSGRLTISRLPMEGDELELQPTIGETLVGKIEKLRDENGIGEITVQWLRDGEKIPGQTGFRYQLTQEDVNARIQFSVRFLDDEGFSERLLSDSIEVSSSLDQILRAMDRSMRLDLSRIQPEPVEDSVPTTLTSMRAVEQSIERLIGEPFVSRDSVYAASEKISSKDQVVQKISQLFSRIMNEVSGVFTTSEGAEDSERIPRVEALTPQASSGEASMTQSTELESGATEVPIDSDVSNENQPSQSMDSSQQETNVDSTSTDLE